MLAERERVQALDDVLLVFRILLVQRFNQSGFDETLFIESLLILKDFEGNELFLFVVENTENNTEGTLAKLLDHFIPEAQVLVVADYILLLV